MDKKAILTISCLLFSVHPQSSAGRTSPTADSFAQAGDQYLRSGNYDAAAQQYSKAIKKDGKNPRYYQQRAKSEAAAKRFKPSINDLSKAIKLNPEDPDNYAYRARAYDSIREFGKEKSDLDKLISMQPGNGSTLLQRAQANLQMKKNMQQVIVDCNEALPLGLQREELVMLYKSRAVAYKNLGKKSEYEQEMAKYQSLMP